jgi:hypothetical protein
MFRKIFPVTVCVLSAASCLLTGCPKRDHQTADVPDAKPLPPAPKVTESCDVAGLLGFCMDYTQTDVMMHRTLCEGFKGKFNEVPCSKERLTGSCEMADGDIKRYYDKLGPKDVGFTPEKAKENCESPSIKGRFVPKPASQ